LCICFKKNLIGILTTILHPENKKTNEKFIFLNYPRQIQKWKHIHSFKCYLEWLKHNSFLPKIVFAQENAYSNLISNSWMPNNWVISKDSFFFSVHFKYSAVRQNKLWFVSTSTLSYFTDICSCCVKCNKTNLCCKNVHMLTK